MTPLVMKCLNRPILALKQSAVSSPGSGNPVWAFGGMLSNPRLEQEMDEVLPRGSVAP
jgi:hypothetical protein